MLKSKKEQKEIQEKIDKLNAEIQNIEQSLVDNVIKSFFGVKCEHCGCYDGIHKLDCSFMRRYC